MTKSSSKRIIFSVISAVLLASPSAFAGAVTNWTGTDGFSAEPYLPGTNIIHLRLDSAFTGNTGGSSLIPGINYSTSPIEGLDFGIGGGVSFLSIGSKSNSMTFGALYPWVRAAVPLGLENVKTGIMVGTSVPINNNPVSPSVSNNINGRSANEYFPGITALVDVYLGQLNGSDRPLTLGINAGYARGITTGTNLVSGNLNFTAPALGLVFYEEQFVNLPVGNYSNGGVRVGVNVPVGKQFMFDFKPAALWDTSSSGINWSFNPSIGASMKF
jgi:hypothetical protein